MSKGEEGEGEGRRKDERTHFFFFFFFFFSRFGLRSSVFTIRYFGITMRAAHLKAAVKEQVLRNFILLFWFFAIKIFRYFGHFFSTELTNNKQTIQNKKKIKKKNKKK